MGERNAGGIKSSQMPSNVGSFLRKAIFSVLCAGPIPNHIAFIMDGNRRYARKKSLSEGAGHSVGFSTLLNMLKYCFEMGVKYITAYAFSIDNFKRSPEEVQSLMRLMQQKMEELAKEEGILNEYGVRVHFAGNLNLLTQSVKELAEKVMSVTANNTSAVLSICIAYTSTDEITCAIRESCQEKCDRIQELNEGGAYDGLNGVADNRNDQSENLVDFEDIERRMYMGIAPDPDIIIRTSGETRLSNFLLWQSSSCLLYFPVALWPEIGLRHLIWAVVYFQRNHSYLKKKKSQLSEFQHSPGLYCEG